MPTVPMLSVYIPAGQTLQSSIDSLRVCSDGIYIPLGQPWHAVEPVALVNVPVLHGRQSSLLSCLDEAFERYFAMGQFWQSSKLSWLLESYLLSTKYRPSGQGMQAVAFVAKPDPGCTVPAIQTKSNSQSKTLEVSLYKHTLPEPNLVILDAEILIPFKIRVAPFPT